MIVIAIWACLAGFYFKETRFFTLDADRVPAKISLWHVAGAFCVFGATYGIFMPLLIKVFPFGEWYNIFALGVLFLALAVFCLFSKDKIAPLFSLKHFWDDVSSGIRLWFFAFPLILLWSNGIDNLIYFWFNKVPTDQMAVQVVKAAEANPKLLYTLIAFVTLLVPFLEELLFRGFLQNSLRGVIGPVFAVIITSFFFAFFHFSPEQGLTNITFVSSLFILSCFLGFLMEKKKTVWAPMALHAFFNLMSILFILGRNYFA